MKIKESFENFWKIKSMNKRFKEKDKERYYEIFLDGYGLACIDIENSTKSEKEKEKMKIHKPKTIIEAINDLQQFLEADLYSKFKPIEMIKGEKWCREDYFKNEKDFYKYIEYHFELLRKQVKELNATKEQITKSSSTVSTTGDKNE